MCNIMQLRNHKFDETLKKLTLNRSCRSADLEKSVFRKFWEGQNHNVSFRQPCWEYQHSQPYLQDIMRLHWIKLCPNNDWRQARATNSNGSFS